MPVPLKSLIGSLPKAIMGHWMTIYKKKQGVGENNERRTREDGECYKKMVYFLVFSSLISLSLKLLAF